MSDDYKVIIHPDCDMHVNSFVEMDFSTLDQARAAENACADLLLFLQDEIKVMPDRSNLFVVLMRVDGEWGEVDDSY